MHRYRINLSLLLCLVLLMQVLAVSTTARMGLIESEQTVSINAAADRPCHRPAQDNGTPRCCNADCPDMTTCALSHIAVVPFVPLTFAILPDHFVAEAASLCVSFIPPSLLRPPISLHG